MRRTPVIAASTVALVALAGCGSVSKDSSASPGANTASAGANSASSAPAASGVSKGAYVNVVKLTGIAWFDRMNEGVKEFKSQSGLNASQTGPSTNSPEQQVSVIQSLIAQKPAVLAVVPSDPNAVTAVLTKAMGDGIKVVTHEAPSETATDADIEAFDNTTYGEKIMTDMAGCMKDKGEYVQFVGTLTAETHMAWSNAAYALQQSKFPNMKRVSAPVESQNNADTAYTKAKQLLQAHPNLVGFEGASSEDVPGIAKAVQEAGLQNETCVFGTGVPSETKQFVADGSIDSIYLWDPKLAGEAMLKIGQMLVDGKEVAAGTDLGIEGYNSLKADPKNAKTFYGNAMLSLTKANIGKYNF